MMPYQKLIMKFEFHKSPATLSKLRRFSRSSHLISMKKTRMAMPRASVAIKAGLLCMCLGLVTSVIAKPLVIEITQMGSEANTKLSATDKTTGTLRWNDENSRSSFGPSLSANFHLLDEYRFGFKYSPSSGRQVGQVGRYECFLLCAWVGSDTINGKSGGSVLNYKLNNFLIWADKEFPYESFKITPKIGMGVAAGKFDFQLNGNREVTSGAIPAPAVGVRIETFLPNGLILGLDSEFYRSRIAQSEIKWADTRFFFEKEIAKQAAVKLGYSFKNFDFDYSDSKIQSNLNSKRDAIFLSLSIRLF
jgi:hypothetical protein